MKESDTVVIVASPVAADVGTKIQIQQIPPRGNNGPVDRIDGVRRDGATIRLTLQEGQQLDRVVKGQIEIFNTAIGLQETLIIVITPVILLLLAFFLKRTKLGLAIRAVEQNRDSALLAGVNVGRVYPLVFAVSAALAALAGVLLAGLFFITPVMGSDPLLRAFIVVVFGGLGSLPGTVVGAYVIGIIEAIAVFFVGLYWAPVVLFIVLILVMIVRPTGLMGGQE